MVTCREASDTNVGDRAHVLGPELADCGREPRRADLGDAAEDGLDEEQKIASRTKNCGSVPPRRHLDAGRDETSFEPL
jgi:hypothetical protein